MLFQMKNKVNYVQINKNNNMNIKNLIMNNLKFLQKYHN